MALFRWWRDPVIYGDAGYPHSAAIERFWARWAGLSDAAAAAVEDGDAHRLRALIDSPVREIHPDLAWHAGPGVRATFMLVVSGARHPALRVVAERWRRAGPPDSPAWEFHPATPAEPAAFEALVQVAGIELDPAEAVAMV